MSELSSCIEVILIRIQIAEHIAWVSKRYGINYPTLSDELKDKIGL